MRRIGLEWKKLVFSPIFFGLLLFFLAINIGIMLSYYDENAYSILFAEPDIPENWYAQVDIGEYAEKTAAMATRIEAAKEGMREKYRRLAPRIAEMAASGEGLAPNIDEKRYPLHHMFYGLLLKAVLLESIALAMLFAALSIEYERETADIVYASRRGRKLARDKLCAVLLTSLCAYLPLFLLSSAAFLSIFPVWHIVDVSVSSLLHQLNFGLLGWQPFITWIQLTEAQYFFCFLGMGMVFVLLCAGLAFATCLLIKNSYAGIGASVLLYLLPAMVGSFGGWAYIISLITPFYAVQYCIQWFTDGFVNAFIPWFETCTAAIWLVLTGIALAFSLRRFKKVNLA